MGGRRQAIGWLAAFACATSAGCGSCGHVSTESHVDVPTQIADVKKLAHPPDVVVDVERKHAEPGGGACGHSPLCVIVIPVAIYGALFPDEWDEVSVRDHGKLSYQARFEKNGDYLDGTKWEPSRARFYGALVLKKLGKRLILQLAEAPLGEDGGLGEKRRVPVLPQVNLIGEYEAALAREHDADARAGLVLEAATWLHDEAVAFVNAHEKDAKEPDDMRAQVLAGLCEGRDALADGVFASAKEKPGPETILAGLRCANRSQRPDERLAFAKPGAEELCGAKESSKTLEGIAAELPASGELAAAAEHCASPPVKALLRRVSGAKLGAPELAAAMRDPSPLVALLAKRLSWSDPDDRAAAFAGIETHVELLPLIEAIPELPPLSAAELRSLGKSYATPARKDDLPGRARLLRLFDKAYRGGVDATGARVELELALSREAEQSRALYRLGLLVLGDRQQAAAASRGLGAASDRLGRAGVDSEADLFGLGFALAGCDANGVRRAYSEARGHKDSDRGALCTK